MEKNKVKFKQVISRDEAVTYLEDMLDSLKSGSLVVQRDDDQLVLKPSERLEVEVEAKVKKHKRKFSLELSWSEDQGADLSITSEEKAGEDERASEKVPAEVPGDGEVRPTDETPPAIKQEAKAPAKSRKTPPAKTSPASRGTGKG